MISLGNAGLIVAPVPQGVPADAASEGAIEFLQLFERALGSGIAAQVIDRPISDISGQRSAVSDQAPADLIGTSGGKRQPIPAGSKREAERGVDPALAVLIAALSQPQQGTQVLTVPGPDRVVDLPSQARTAAPPVETTLQVAVLPPTLAAQGARQTPPPADAHSSDVLMPMVEQPTASPVAIPVEIGTLLQPGSAAITPSPVQSGPLKDNASTHAKPNLPEEGAIPSATLVRMSLSPPHRPSAVGDKSEAPIITTQSLLPPPDVRVTLEPADAETSDPRTAGQPVTPFRSAVEVVRIEQPETVPSPDRVVDLPSQAVAAMPSVEISPWAAVLPPSGVRVTLEPADAREGLRVPLPDADQPEGGQRSGDFLLTKDALLLMTSAKEVQDGISRSNGDPAMEQKGSLPGAAVSMEGPARAAVAPPEETTGRSSLPQYSGVRFSTPSDPSKVIGPEVFEGEGSSERPQVWQADGDRAVMRQGSSRAETTQDMQQDRSAFDSEGGSRSSDRSSPPSHDGRQVGGDFTLKAPPRAGELRLESAAPPMHTGSLVDQVAEQVAEAARMSLRSEGGQVHLRLHPKALGELLIDISWKDGGIVAAIKVQSHAAGEYLTNDLGRLKTALDQQGIRVSDLGVQVGLDLRHGSFEGNGFRPSPTIEYAREAIPWRDRGLVPPNALSMKTDSLIDITV
ncbi:flagellar hook-length control protein FliK [Candidatus Methylomirabilis sp.]|uniref:flagellar hook-length control protein FliK n=1 Tax=Candidatus Methylomirabilis sp. TaxID=2032687 RepID=UPI003C719084